MKATVKQLRPDSGFVAAPAGAAPEAHLTVSEVTRIYGGNVHALGPISVDLRKNEFFAVVGPSGCGKSTFLDVLAGLNRVTSGEIRFEGLPIRGEVPEGVGVVFQEDASFPWLTVANNIAFGLRRRGMAKAEIAKR